MWRHEHADEETLGLLARTYKDLAREAGSPDERQGSLQQALRFYLEAYRRSGGYWPGINAATVALLLGDRPRASALARDVRAQCLRLSEESTAEAGYWIAATLGEAALVLGNRDEAQTHYAKAATLGRRRFGALASTRRNARLILQEIGGPTAFVDQCLPMPRVAAFSGHLLDAPGRSEPRFPPELAPAVKAAIASRLKALDIQFGFASAAAGADLIFLETLIELGGEAHVVLPCDREQFARDSVAPAAGGAWVPRFERVLERAAAVAVASTNRIADGQVADQYTLQLTDGMAGLRADELDAGMVRLAAWDGRPGDGPGGTAGAVAWWRASGHVVEVIDLAAVLERTPVAIPRPAARQPPAAHPARARSSEEPFATRIVSVLFADAHGFSALTEPQIVSFVRHFLGAVAAEIARAPHPPLLKNTWGDGLYLVFERVRDAGWLALALCDTIGRTDWTTHNLPPDLGLRIGLHAGPAFACTDPVTGQMNYLGAHISRAARIEPVTPPGLAYASGAFAALARAEQVRDFHCEYVGQTPLAKGYGTHPMYVMRRGAARR